MTLDSFCKQGPGVAKSTSNFWILKKTTCCAVGAIVFLILGIACNFIFIWSDLWMIEQSGVPLFSIRGVAAFLMWFVDAMLMLLTCYASFFLIWCFPLKSRFEKIVIWPLRFTMVLLGIAFLSGATSGEGIQNNPLFLKYLWMQSSIWYFSMRASQTLTAKWLR